MAVTRTKLASSLKTMSCCNSGDKCNCQIIKSVIFAVHASCSIPTPVCYFRRGWSIPSYSLHDYTRYSEIACSKYRYYHCIKWYASYSLHDYTSYSLIACSKYRCYHCKKWYAIDCVHQLLLSCELQSWIWCYDNCASQLALLLCSLAPRPSHPSVCRLQY